MIFREGEVSFEASQAEGQVTKKLPVFYNPEMEFDRDLAVAIARAVRRAHGGYKYCDALAGSGIRGMRAVKEAGYTELCLNDCAPVAVKLMRENLKRNKIKAEVHSEDINLFLRGFKCDKFDAIDVDPFGSFIGALDSALRAIRRDGGLLCLTATDTAALNGVSKNACRRKYDALPIRTSFAKEVGLRILIGACARAAAKYEFAVRPLFTYARRHYFRLFLMTENGASRADKMLEEISYLQHCLKCDWRGYAGVDEFEAVCPNCGASGALQWAGPLWKGRFADPKLKVESGNPKVGELVELVKGEQKITLPFFDVHRLCELSRRAAPKKADVMASLKNSAKTHFCQTGVRSDVLPKLG